ncbi:GLPGLI family protein [Chryseobacterium sp. PMSZPI]|uniref:GLPGLI family protein n=1 Tax=Chryseobacterium sp. PMSZPI TaxID=1033900 RepID=UPI000C34CE8B|nr:GLPGLI family protein [Chryseobacterium sp. PMSZPI]PKF74218.1 GLPGLI family protein [Chryseobacterium sp. PMSZPI]
MYYYKKLFQLLALFFSVLFFSQLQKKDTLRGEFTYLLKAKLSTLTPDYKHEEFFSLQIGDKRAFFASTQSIKRDSTFQTTQHKKLDNGGILLSTKGMNIPKTKFYYTIIQSNENIQYFDSVSMSLLMYKEPVIKNWKLIDETKIINTITCKKAEVNFKGRNWVAWYSPEIPLPYGPYKFSGLPGLIIKITDDKGDYDFELIKSVSNSVLKGRLITIKKSRYTEAIETTRPKFEQALKDANANLIGVLQSSETTIIQGQEIIRQRQKEREENKKYENPIELEKD